MQEPRSTQIKLIYEGADISRDIAPYLLSFEYTDKSSGESDDLQISLEDRDANWRDPWYPNKGDKIEASIITHSWDSPGGSKSLYCGSFEVVEVEISEPPMTVSIKAVSVPRSSSLRNEDKTRAWEEYSLSRIAGDIADNGGLELSYDADNDPSYDRTDQVETPDLQYLHGLCTDAGLALKVTDKKIVIYDEEVYEGRGPVSTIQRGDYRIISVNLKTKMAGTFKEAKVSYHDSLKNVKHESLISDEAAPKNGQTLKINQRVRSEGEAEALGKKKLYQANKKEVTGSFTLAGDLGLVGGSNVDVKGWGKFDGTYFIETAKHSYGSGGYVTTLDIREGGPSKKGKKSGGKGGKKGSVNVKHESLIGGH